MERVFLPKPLPGDPEQPDEEMEEARKRTVSAIYECVSMSVTVSSLYECDCEQPEEEMEEARKRTVSVYECDCQFTPCDCVFTV